jgi:hypothetical protein
MAGKIALGIVCLLLSGLFGYSYRGIHVRNEMLPCVVKRVVHEGDEPASIDRGQIARPYTIVVYQQPYETFIVPGAIGEEDSEIWLTPPGNRDPSFLVR